MSEDAKKVVLKLHLHDEEAKTKAMKKVSSLHGIDSLSMDMKEKKLTAIGDVDPAAIVCRLRKCWCAEILSVGPAKEEKKTQETKKPVEPTKETKKEDDLTKQLVELLKACQDHKSHAPVYHCVHGAESPSDCAMC